MDTPYSFMGTLFRLQIATTKNELSHGNTAREITDNIRFFCILNERLLFIVLWNSNNIRQFCNITIRNIGIGTIMKYCLYDSDKLVEIFQILFQNWR